MGNVCTSLWFHDRCREAVDFYVGLIPNSKITSVSSTGGVEIVDFTLDGAPFNAINGGTHFTLNEAASIRINTPDQAETDRLWAALTADGGQESMCGWLKDRFGLWWQIVPEDLPRLLAEGDAAASRRVVEAMMQMKKIDIAALQAAYDKG